MSSPLAREEKFYTGELYDKLSESLFSVTIEYYSLPELSIESYELEGDNISREELVQKFGARSVRELEENLT